MGLLGFLRGGVSGALDQVVNLVIGLFVDSLGDAIEGLFAGFFVQATRPQVTAAFFIGDGGAYQTVASISCLFLAGGSTVGVVVGIVSGEPGQAFARIVRDIPLAVLAIIGFPWLVEQLLVLTDVISETLIPSDEIIKRLAGRLAAPPEHDIAGVFVASLTFMTTVLIFLELLVRNALALIVTALAPLSFAARTTGSARSVVGQVMKISVAVAFSKPAVFVALRVGTDFLEENEQPITPSSWGRYLTAVAVVMISAFMPFVVWRLIPLAEAYVLAQGISRAPFRAAMQTVQSAYWLQALGQGRSAGRRGGRGQGEQSAQGPEQRPPGGSLGGSRSLPDPQTRQRRRRHQNPPAQAQPAGTSNQPGPDSGSGGADAGGHRSTHRDPPRQRRPPSADGSAPGPTPRPQRGPRSPSRQDSHPRPSGRQPPDSRQPSGSRQPSAPPPGWRRRQPADPGGAATSPPEGPRP